MLNKIDRGRRARPPPARQPLPGRAARVSAATGEGLEELKARLAEQFASRWELVRLLVPYADGAALSDLYALGAPIESREDTAEGVLVLARLPRRDLRPLRALPRRRGRAPKRETA